MKANYEDNKLEMTWVEFYLKIHRPPSILDRIKLLQGIETSEKILDIMRVIAAMEPVRQAAKNKNDKRRNLEGADHETYLDDVFDRIVKVEGNANKIFVYFITALLIQGYDSDNWSKLYTDTEEGRKTGEEKYKVDTESIREFLENDRGLKDQKITEAIEKFREEAKIIPKDQLEIERTQNEKEAKAKGEIKVHGDEFKEDAPIRLGEGCLTSLNLIAALMTNFGRRI
ncbi:unnamed protein product [Cylicocyclus nassatus]|uniref:Uncharacterized protein n=1 Tax=Cylicocyclus nassatus TaxID=53992 RepID=A0AA36GEV1_CYLNA|nr:unnamed protein product [Cylicocyclus nassatus]